jgi:membrane protease YdiL (CAAX protease family)
MVAVTADADNGCCPLLLFLQVPVTGLLFASAHPADAFPAEALLGSILSVSLLAADGNLFVPLLAHSLYNMCVLCAEFFL